MLQFSEVGRLLEAYMHTGEIPIIPGISDEQNMAFNHIAQAIPHGMYANLEFKISFFLQEEHRLKGVTDGDEYYTQTEQRRELRELLSEQKNLRQLSAFRNEMSNDTIAAILVEDLIVLAQKSE